MFLHELTPGLALATSLQQALANDDSAVHEETFNMDLDGNDDEWISEDGACDSIINDLRGKHRDPGIRCVIYLSIVLT